MPSASGRRASPPPSPSLRRIQSTLQLFNSDLQLETQTFAALSVRITRAFIYHFSTAAWIVRALCSASPYSWTQSSPIFDHPERAAHGLIAWLTDWLAYGHYAVTVFIAISGFSLGLPIARGNGRLRKGALDFFQRRSVRILPPYYAALLIAYLVACLSLHRHTGSAYDSALPTTAFGFWSHLFLIHDFWPVQFEADPPLWSIAVECQLYLFFPLLVFLRRKLGTASVLLSPLPLDVALSLYLHLRRVCKHVLLSAGICVWHARCGCVLR